jgi:hypothetical protein
MSPETEAYGPNVTAILFHAMRVVRGKIPPQVRRELSTAVKAGVLGHLKKDGLKPEVYFHPDHKHGAIERQKCEALFAVDNIAKVILHGSEKAEYIFNILTKEEERNP